MAKVIPINDLHLEHCEYYLLRNALTEGYRKDTVLSIAGDVADFILESEDAIEFFKSMASAYKAIVYVPGNHCLFGTYIDRARAFRTDIERLVDRDNFHCLVEGDKMEIDDTVFIGATLWSNVDLVDDTTRERLPHAFPDFSLILDSATEKPITADKYQREFTYNAFCIQNALSKIPEGKTVWVVTHHGPSPKSIVAHYEGNPYNPLYVSDLRHLLDKVDVWHHGHTHSCLDYVEEGCRIVNNARGYGMESSFTTLTFDPDWVIEL